VVDLGMILVEARERWLYRRIPLACPARPRGCSGRPKARFARFALANEVLRCRKCGKGAHASKWRLEGAFRSRNR
jgi:hypothetical protein